jgi:hypothetical protein
MFDSGKLHMVFRLDAGQKPEHQIDLKFAVEAQTSFSLLLHDGQLVET